MAQRTREIGIRLALGAYHGQVVRLGVGRGLRIVAAATVLGRAAAFAGARLLRGQLFGVSASDMLTFVTVPTLLAAVASLACYVPARRASRVDPLVALKSE